MGKKRFPENGIPPRSQELPPDPSQLEEVSSVESVWIHSSSINYNAGDFLKADIEIITEDPWTAQWKSETLRKEILRKVQIEETQIRPEQFVDIAKFNYKEALTDNKEQ